MRRSPMQHARDPKEWILMPYRIKRFPKNSAKLSRKEERLSVKDVCVQLESVLGKPISAFARSS